MASHEKRASVPSVLWSPAGLVWPNIYPSPPETRRRVVMCCASSPVISRIMVTTNFVHIAGETPRHQVYLFK